MSRSRPDCRTHLQECRNLRTLREETWPQSETLQNKLYGPVETLQKTTSFISELVSKFVRVASQPCPRCMCSYSALTLKTANIRFMSNGHRLMNVQERHLPKKKWKLRTLGLAFGSSTVAYLLYHQDAEVKNLEFLHSLGGAKQQVRHALAFLPNARVSPPESFLSDSISFQSHDIAL
ncbi:hypothetical protein C0Q70_06681 [Pomacea canaliculata]|uniref:Uncharacterized protein n=1 Tax=Pomacea canaliculata TaxID=400727 RepID=A0A2T7PCY3_POMCA|nr:hypothetical protein C0Q70_06681 [Pomacea canaliculata]